MKRTTAIWISLVVMLVISIMGMQLYRTLRAGMLEKQAVQLMDDGDYAQAKIIYTLLDDEDNAALCESMEQEQSYQQGLQLLSGGELEQARECLAALGDYKNALALSENCDWQTALDSGDVERLSQIYSFFSALSSDYADTVLSQISAALYAKALDDASDFKLTEACEIWTLLGDYEDSSTLLWRGQRAAAWSKADGGSPIISDSNLYMSREKVKVYLTDLAYVVVPNRLDQDAKYFIYYPGGRDEELSLDYLYYYLANPSSDTIAIFLLHNGLGNMENKTCRAIDLLEQVAAEKFLFVSNIVTVGSSLGAYPAMHAPMYTYDNYRITTDCVLSLDAGSDWEEVEVLLDEDECIRTAQLGTEFYLFESIGVGMNRQPIRHMVNTGNNVTIVECVYDDHVQISLDAMGMGVMEWAVTDRSENCNPDWYRFVVLQPDE